MIIRIIDLFSRGKSDNKINIFHQVINRFKQLMANDQIEDANAIGEEYICNGEATDDNYQWLCVNYQSLKED